MNAVTVFNIIGITLITCAVLVHIICLGMPDYIHADLTRLKSQINDQHMSEHILDIIIEISDLQLKVNYGLWSVCYKSKLDPNIVCKYWDQKLTAGEWIRVTQVLAILGGVFMISAAVGSALNLIFKYRGNTQTTLPNYICILACIGGIIMFIGDSMIISNHKTFPAFIEGQQDLPDQVKTFLGKQFKLSWGLGCDIIASVAVCFGGIAHQLASHYEEKAVLYGAVV